MARAISVADGIAGEHRRGTGVAFTSDLEAVVTEADLTGGLTARGSRPWGRRRPVAVAGAPP